MEKRLEGIDLLKGILIVLVITGHILQGAVETNLPRYIIYSFHMPLFMGVSGYLFNWQKKLLEPFKVTAFYYLERVLVPWFLAVFTYLLITSHFKVSGILLVKSIVYPYYHLWYIPAFLFYIFFAYVLLKFKLPIQAVTIIGLAISVNFFSLEHWPLHKSIFANVIEAVSHTLRPKFLFFFLLGVQIRQIPANKTATLFLTIAVLLFFIIDIYSYNFQNSKWLIPVFFVFNTLLIVWILQLCKSSKLRGIAIFEWIGTNSLSIYLWHIIPLIAVNRFFGFKNANSLSYLLTAYCAEGVFLISIYFLNKVSPIRRYFFGLKQVK